MKYFRERQTVLWSLPVLFLLSGCGGAEPECDSPDARNSVVKIVSSDSNNALANYAAKNSSVVEARVNKASTEAERLAIWEAARQGASYGLGAISTNSKSRRAVTCSTYARAAQLWGYPLLMLGLDGDGKKQRCQRGSEFRCAPAVAALVGKLVAEVAPDHHAA
jgi:hypothetical protein